MPIQGHYLLLYQLFKSLQFLGMPEGRIPLAQAVGTNLASAPKSNASYMGINEALDWVKNNGHLPVPLASNGCSL